MKNIHYILFFLIGLHGFSQNKMTIELLSGAGFNKEILLADNYVDDYISFTTQINANYKIKVHKKINVETGFGVQAYFSSGEVLISKFNVSSLRLNIPFIISYDVFKNAFLGAGIVIANNRDLSAIDFRANYNLRSSLLVKTGYNLKEKLTLLLALKNNLSDIPDLFFIDQPRLDVSIGLSYKLF